MKFLLSFAVIAFTACAPAFAQSPPAGTTKVNPLKLLDAVTTTGAGTAYLVLPVDKTFQACGTTSAGSGASTTKIQVSNVAAPGSGDWVDLATITLVLGTTESCDGFASAARWKWWRANETAISGTTGTVTATMGY